MNDINKIKNALLTLISDNTFYIDKIKIDENNFGNVLVVLRSKNKLNIRFIKDRGDFWCEIGQAEEWFFLEDLFSVLGLNPIANFQEFIDFITVTSTEIKKNLAKMEEAFTDKNRKNTQIKIAKFSTKRTLGIFNL